MGILIIAISCVISATLYRAGGMSQESTAKPAWIPLWMRKSWVRDGLCPLVLLGAVIALFGLKIDYWWAYLLTYGLSWGALSTYWDFITGDDNFYLHGLGCSLATIPLLWCEVPWWIILLHGIVCTVGMGLWSSYTDTDWLEEKGRGVLFVL